MNLNFKRTHIMNHVYTEIELETIFYQNRFYYFKFNATEFYQSLKDVIENSTLDITSNIRIPCSQNVDLADFFEEYKFIQIFSSNFDHTEMFQKLKNVEYNRLEKIFHIWILYVSLYPQSMLNQVTYNLWSLNEIITLAKISLTKRDDSYVFKPFKPIQGSEFNHQLNTMVRIICSQDCLNLQIALQNELDLAGFEFRSEENPRFKTILHWAYFCNNSQMLNLLVQNKRGLRDCSLLSDSTYQKDFKMSLVIAKNLNLLNLNLPLVESAKHKFDGFHYLVHDSFLVDCYTTLSDRQIIDMFNVLFSIGLSLKIRHRTCEYEYSEFTFCICQSSIRVRIVEFLLDRFVNEINGDQNSKQVQTELSNTISYLIHYYESLDEIMSRSTKLVYLKINEILLILRTLYPLLNKRFKVFHANQFSIQHYLIYQISSQANSMSLYDTDEFKFIDFLLNYNIFSTIEEMDSLFASAILSLNKENLFLLTVYILENNFLSGRLALSWFELTARKVYFSEEFKLFLTQCLFPLCMHYMQTPRELKFLAKEAVRNSLPSISDRNIVLIGNLPANLVLYLKKTKLVARTDLTMTFFK